MKRTCDRTLTLINNGYLDGELGPAETAEVETHLRDCPACRETARQFSALELILRSVPRESPPENVWHGVKAAIAGHSRRLRAGKFVFALAAAAAVALMVIIPGLLEPQSAPLALPPSLASLSGLDEGRDLNVNFGSTIEQLLM